jgi:hypothetical protein
VVVGHLGVLRTHVDVLGADAAMVRVSRGKRDLTKGGDQIAVLKSNRFRESAVVVCALVDDDVLDTHGDLSSIV